MPRTTHNPEEPLAMRLCRRIERTAAFAQGKGYGTSSITQEVKLALKALNRTPELAVDIGGNIGTYTAELLLNAPNVEVHIFEPSSANQAKLRDKFSLRKNIVLVSRAVSNTPGTTTLFSNSPGSGLGSLSKRRLDHFGISFDHAERVEAVRFDSYWEMQLNRKIIDIAKLDIEGHELSALISFGTALTSTRVVQFEFGGSNIDTRTYFQDFWYFFTQHSFALFRITPFGLDHIERYRESDEVFAVTNFIAINQNMI